VRRYLLALIAIATAYAQLGPAPAKPKPARNAKEAAPVDLTGYWVSVITEDWRWRMVTPPIGDFAGIPLTAEGRKIGNAWDPAKDESAGEQCKSYGAPALLRIPGRLHITWEDDDTLRIDADQGSQTRLLHFKASQGGQGEASWQGYSIAQWEPPLRGSGSPQQGLGATREGNRGQSLQVVTTGLRPGYLRKNGPPYSGNAVLKEFFDLSVERNGDSWFAVTTIVEDPPNLSEPFVTSTNFKKQRDGTGFSPTPCSAR
jgi:hypothetical protein